MMEEILKRVPQRPPFLFIDKLLEQNDCSIIMEKKMTGEEDFFRGHFPGNPIMPGVLLQEACFQAASFFISQKVKKKNGPFLGVVTGVEKARFKGFVRPGDLLKIIVGLNDCLENAYYMQGKITVDDKTVLTLKFTCALVKQDVGM